MSRQVYTEDSDEVNAKLAEAESQWTEYKTNETVTAMPAYTVKKKMVISLIHILEVMSWLH